MVSLQGQGYSQAGLVRFILGYRKAQMTQHALREQDVNMAYEYSN